MGHNRDYKPEDIAFPNQVITESELVGEMEDSYKQYAMSVIVGRALPDVRDGLKPVHRRILYSITKSGETAESIYLAGLLKERRVNMWLLTFVKDSTLTREIPNSVVLDLTHEGDLWNIVPNNSTTMNLIVLQGLAMMVANKMGLKLEDFKRNHPGGAIGQLLR